MLLIKNENEKAVRLSKNYKQAEELVIAKDAKIKELTVEIEKEQAEATLSNILNNLPGHIYWKDMNSVYTAPIFLVV